MAPSARDTRPLAVRVYEEISSDITAGIIEAGTALVQEQVASQYGVSRTPVRDALTQLAVDGMATLVPGHGYIVNKLSPQDVKDVYEVRYTLEAMAARQACGLHSPQQLVRLRGMVDEFETVDPNDAEELFRMGAAFHAALVEPCPNIYLRNTLAAMWDHPIARRITMTYRQGPEHQATIARDHRSILESLKTNDPDTIAEVLSYCHNSNDNHS